MTIQSSLTDLALFDLLQVLNLNKKTGRLIITDGPEAKEAHVVFRNGDICFAVIHDKLPKTTESVLLEWGVIDDRFAARFEKVTRKYSRLLDCLEGEGVAPRTHIENFISSRIKENIYEILKWEEGDCRFIEEDVDERKEIVIPLNTENLILEGARRIDEWSNIKSKVGSAHAVFRLCSESETEKRLNLKPREWEILSLIDGNRSVKEVNDAVGGDLFTTSKLIYGLVVMGVIEPVEESVGKEDESGKEERVDELLKSAKDFYEKLNLEKAAAQYEKALKIEPECFEALRMLGEIYYKLDRLSEALIYLDKARQIRPDNQKAMFIKGYLHARLGEVTRAISEWEELLEKAKNPKLVGLVSRRIAIARKWEKVLEEY
ncbi:MAG: hypothetical protein B6D63_03745 [Candidatus Latescibacteria bacterium 4484_7]|nr:MAG: hypothetical protein B6D63_03745 [Candidatus Latescibacteria bacterium 4484_7]